MALTRTRSLLVTSAFLAAIALFEPGVTHSSRDPSVESPWLSCGDNP